MSIRIGGFNAKPIPVVGSSMDFSGTKELGFYATEATQRHSYGRRALMWDGSVVRYCNAAAAITNCQLAAHFTVAGLVAIETIAATEIGRASCRGRV